MITAAQRNAAGHRIREKGIMDNTYAGNNSYLIFAGSDFTDSILDPSTAEIL